LSLEALEISTFLKDNIIIVEATKVAGYIEIFFFDTWKCEDLIPAAKLLDEEERKDTSQVRRSRL
jgi:hypothetical protein